MKKKEGQVTRLIRQANKAYRKKIPILPGIIIRIVRVLFSCDIPYQTEIGKGTVFIHNGLGTVIHEKTKIGKYNKIMQNVTIGGRNGRGAPIIGDFCFIGAGACVMGDIKIGDNVIIGANAVVTKSIPSNAVVAGIPAKIIKEVDKEMINKFKN